MFQRFLHHFLPDNETLFKIKYIATPYPKEHRTKKDATEKYITIINKKLCFIKIIAEKSMIIIMNNHLKY